MKKEGYGCGPEAVRRGVNDRMRCDRKDELVDKWRDPSAQTGGGATTAWARSPEGGREGDNRMGTEGTRRDEGDPIVSGREVLVLFFQEAYEWGVRGGDDVNGNLFATWSLRWWRDLDPNEGYTCRVDGRCAVRPAREKNVLDRAWNDLMFDVMVTLQS
ncbi:hypothetical protein TREMEDRAFT_63885 [Tremella mesenterica DSM 1558]|uniref:uncharacterized protein n=1 Tax=Tremella mesenterica (strain ATCC 24925 / CBS 8224 / DSM 1558 / NBRC 9311 / NRRL Y-6157 / RJB 2259-6 / UBC 559-6) TaxID=578456 RepID=UPI0003F49035|nr:uncharacterized protein TREMEDRAFT_63885 [Tremella mesenterica DSM 1558]EIW68001.1 hypothetical protein TREMEDRAFT_63885 [Tremella mesenterica DSM 1558]